MSDIILYFLTAWLAIGTGIFCAGDARWRWEKVMQQSLKRRGRLPGMFERTLAALGLIVAWPLSVWAYLDAKFEVRRR